MAKWGYGQDMDEEALRQYAEGLSPVARDEWDMASLRRMMQNPLARALVVPPVAAYNLVQSAGQGLTAPGRAYRGEISQDQMRDEALNLGGLVASGTFAGAAPKGAVGMGYTPKLAKKPGVDAELGALFDHLESLLAEPAKPAGAKPLTTEPVAVDMSKMPKANPVDPASVDAMWAKMTGGEAMPVVASPHPTAVVAAPPGYNLADMYAHGFAGDLHLGELGPLDLFDPVHIAAGLKTLHGDKSYAMYELQKEAAHAPTDQMPAIAKAMEIVKDPKAWVMLPEAQFMNDGQVVPKSKIEHYKDLVKNPYATASAEYAKEFWPKTVQSALEKGKVLDLWEATGAPSWTKFDTPQGMAALAVYAHGGDTALAKTALLEMLDTYTPGSAPAQIATGALTALNKNPELKLSKAQAAEYLKILNDEGADTWYPGALAKAGKAPEGYAWKDGKLLYGEAKPTTTGVKPESVLDMPLDYVLGQMAPSPTVGAGKWTKHGQYLGDLNDPEFLPAAHTTLPMDEASQLARAKAMGFNTDLPLYRAIQGTDAYSLDPTGLGFKDPSTKRHEPAIFLSDIPEVTHGYVHDEMPSPMTYKMYARASNPLVVDWPAVSYLGSSYNQATMKKVIKDAWDAGHDYIELRGIHDSGGPQTQYLVRYPNQLRSTAAVFDPAYTDSNNLLRAGGMPLPPDEDTKKRKKKNAAK